MTIVIHREQADRPDLDGLRARASELERRLDERAAEIASVQRELAAFKVQYRQQVGLLHEELDELQSAIADAELGERAAHRDRDADATRDASADARPEPLPRYSSDAVRKLFRDVAKAIHPDLAGDAAARERRHTLMIEANRAYSMGDEERLRRILESWERRPEAVQGQDSESMRERLVRRVAQIEEQLVMLDGDLAALRETPMWQLKAMVDEAAARGKDLVRDMVRRLKRDILAARNRLDAMRSMP